MKKAKAEYVNQMNIFIYQNPNGDCANLSTCMSTTKNCVYHFPTYEQKYNFFIGKNACNNCTCPLTGYSK